MVLAGRLGGSRGGRSAEAAAEAAEVHGGGERSERKSVERKREMTKNAGILLDRY
jgi:hypothetical protein